MSAEGNGANGNGKTALETAYIPGRRGGRLLAGGKPGNKGGGRKPDWLKEFCDNLLANPKTKAAARAILGNPNHPAFAAMWRAAGDRAHGKPGEKLDVKADVVVRVLREPMRLRASD